MRQLRDVAQLRPFAVDTQAGRNKERYRLAFWSVFANVISKSLSMLVMILAVAWTIPYLGQERFGLWMTIASFLAMMSFLDLGVGNALTNRVASVAATQQRDALVRTISVGLALLAAISVAAGALLLIAASTIPWGRLFKLAGTTAIDEVVLAAQTFAVLFAIHLLVSGAQRVLVGMQRAFEVHAFSVVASILSLGALFMATSSQAGLPTLLLATLGCQCVGGVLAVLLLARRGLLGGFTLRSDVVTEWRRLLNVGTLFLILQIGTMVGWGADSLIIAGALGASQVAVFGVVQRLFQFVSQPVAMMNSPLWAAYADAHARQEKAFIRSTFIRSLALSAAFSLIGGTLILVFGQYIVHFWTSGAIFVPQALLALYFLWTVCEVMGNALAMIMNGCNVVRPQVVAVAVFVSISLPLKLVFAVYGLQTIVAITIGAYLVAVPMLYFIFYRMQIADCMQHKKVNEVPYEANF